MRIATGAFCGRAQSETELGAAIVQGGELAGTGAHSHSNGNATKSLEEAAKFKAA